MTSPKIFLMKSYIDKKNDEIYHKICLNKIRDFFEGKMGIVFLAFGLNDSWKTHLIYGNFKDPGFIPLSFNDFFSRFSVISSYGKSLEFSCNFLEIYENSMIYQERGAKKELIQKKIQKGKLMKISVLKKFMFLKLLI